jgi:hypothetical protein
MGTKHAVFIATILLFSTLYPLVALADTVAPPPPPNLDFWHFTNRDSWAVYPSQGPNLVSVTGVDILHATYRAYSQVDQTKCLSTYFCYAGTVRVTFTPTEAVCKTVYGGRACTQDYDVYLDTNPILTNYPVKLVPAGARTPVYRYKITDATVKETTASPAQQATAGGSSSQGTIAAPPDCPPITFATEQRGSQMCIQRSSVRSLDTGTATTEITRELSPAAPVYQDSCPVTAVMVLGLSASSKTYDVSSVSNDRAVFRSRSTGAEATVLTDGTCVGNFETNAYTILKDILQDSTSPQIFTLPFKEEQTSDGVLILTLDEAKMNTKKHSIQKILSNNPDIVEFDIDNTYSLFFTRNHNEPVTCGDVCGGIPGEQLKYLITLLDKKTNEAATFQIIEGDGGFVTLQGAVKSQTISTIPLCTKLTGSVVSSPTNTNTPQTYAKGDVSVTIKIIPKANFDALTNLDATGKLTEDDWTKQTASPLTSCDWGKDCYVTWAITSPTGKLPNTCTLGIRDPDGNTYETYESGKRLRWVAKCDGSNSDGNIDVNFAGAKTGYFAEDLSMPDDSSNTVIAATYAYQDACLLQGDWTFVNDCNLHSQNWVGNQILQTLTLHEGTGAKDTDENTGPTSHEEAEAAASDKATVLAGVFGITSARKDYQTISDKIKVYQPSDGGAYHIIIPPLKELGGALSSFSFRANDKTITFTTPNSQVEFLEFYPIPRKVQGADGKDTGQVVFEDVGFNALINAPTNDDFVSIKDSYTTVKPRINDPTDLVETFADYVSTIHKGPSTTAITIKNSYVYGSYDESRVLLHTNGLVIGKDETVIDQVAVYASSTLDDRNAWSFLMDKERNVGEAKVYGSTLASILGLDLLGSGVASFMPQFTLAVSEGTFTPVTLDQLTALQKGKLLSKLGSLRYANGRFVPASLFQARNLRYVDGVPGKLAALAEQGKVVLVTKKIPAFYRVASKGVGIVQKAGLAASLAEAPIALAGFLYESTAIDSRVSAFEFNKDGVASGTGYTLVNPVSERIVMNLPTGESAQGTLKARRYSSMLGSKLPPIERDGLWQMTTKGADRRLIFSLWNYAQLPANKKLSMSDAVVTVQSGSEAPMSPQQKTMVLTDQALTFFLTDVFNFEHLSLLSPTSGIPLSVQAPSTGSGESDAGVQQVTRSKLLFCQVSHAKTSAGGGGGTPATVTCHGSTPVTPPNLVSAHVVAIPDTGGASAALSSGALEAAFSSITRADSSLSACGADVLTYYLQNNPNATLDKATNDTNTATFLQYCNDYFTLDDLPREIGTNRPYIAKVASLDIMNVLRQGARMLGYKTSDDVWVAACQKGDQTGYVPPYMSLYKAKLGRERDDVCTYKECVDYCGNVVDDTNLGISRTQCFDGCKAATKAGTIKNPEQLDGIVPGMSNEQFAYRSLQVVTGVYGCFDLPREPSPFDTTLFLASAPRGSNGVSHHGAPLARSCRSGNVGVYTDMTSCYLLNLDDSSTKGGTGFCQDATFQQGWDRDVNLRTGACAEVKTVYTDLTGQTC